MNRYEWTGHQFKPVRNDTEVNHTDHNTVHSPNNLTAAGEHQDTSLLTDTETPGSMESSAGASLLGERAVACDLVQRISNQAAPASQSSEFGSATGESRHFMSPCAGAAMSSYQVSPLANDPPESQASAESELSIIEVESTCPFCREMFTSEIWDSGDTRIECPSCGEDFTEHARRLDSGFAVGMA